MGPLGFRSLRGDRPDGNDLERCSAEYTPDDWYGDAGWFPAYPWLVDALHRLGLHLDGTAVVVSWLFAAATLVHWARRRGRDDGLPHPLGARDVGLAAQPVGVSLPRSQAALLPLAVLVDRLPRGAIVALVVAAVPIAICMEKLFLEGRIT